jgi:L-alanine-DL-glutamate epimerase-like enolase superfamily enzyme
MKIANVEAFWLRCPIPKDKQHKSDFGLLTDFDMTLIVVTAENGMQGYGEAKAAVGSSGVCASIVTCIEQEIKPSIIGQSVHDVSRVWEMVYNGSRDHYSAHLGRKFPILGRRGLTISALSGVDTALWDLKGKLLNTSVVNLLGGSCRDTMEAYASGGWADADHIGEQLNSYISRGFKGVKMRVGVMDKDTNTSIQRTINARNGIGNEIKLMTDAHGTMSVPEAKKYCRGVEDCDLYWFEEPCNADNRYGTAEVRKSSSVPIAAGESEYTAFDIRDMIAAEAIDIIQPDAAIIGGITESMRVSALAHTHQLGLAPHCWGSAFSFMAGVSIAFASPAACIIEFSAGGNPMMYDLVNEKIQVIDGLVHCPTAPGLGLTPNLDFIKEYKQ